MYFNPLFLFTFFIISLSSPFASAGGPFVVNDQGVASTWDNASPVSLHPEAGTCGSFSNSEMDSKVEANVAHWSNISNINLDFQLIDGSIGVDVKGSNYETYYVDSSDDAGLNDSINPVVFDDNGDIVADLFGNSNRFSVLGFAGPDGFSPDYSEIVDGQAFFNCRCLDGNLEGSCPGAIVFTEDDLDFTMTHEIGHMLGFDHTQVNQDFAEASDCDVNTAGDCDDLPTMYPQSIDAGDQITPHRDDEVAALTLYGASGWEASLCTVTGSLQDDEGNPLRCADIQATTTDDADTIAIVSGAFAPAEDNNGDGYTDAEGECLSDCGNFVLRGLDPSKDYTVTVRPVDSQWTGGSSISPCGTGQVTGIEEEVIATVTDCGAGQTQSLGTIKTSSTGGVTEGEDDDDEDDSSSGSSGLSCSLSPRTSKPLSYLFLPLGTLSLGFCFVILVFLIRRLSSPPS